MIIKVDANNLDWIKKSIQFENDIPVDANMTENIGVNLVTRYLLPFEAISILLMVALVGAAHLSRKGRGEYDFTNRFFNCERGFVLCWPVYDRIQTQCHSNINRYRADAECSHFKPRSLWQIRPF